MCASTELRRALVLASLIAAALTGACFDEHPCVVETCDGLDNDCDGRADEDYVDAQGRYANAEHCGGCGMACAEALPSAETTACVVGAGSAPECRVDSCPEGFAPVSQHRCEPKLPVLCFPCSEDDDCAARVPGAQCFNEADGSGRCGSPCASELDCPVGYRCQEGEAGSQCRPNGGSCLCTAATEGADLACELRGHAGHLCPGLRTCRDGKLGACASLLEERCNEQDDDCDGQVDEDFLDGQGRLTLLDHCGACGRRCVALGPHTVPTCTAAGDEAVCLRGCEPEYVDVDGVAANGCECRLTTGPDVVVSGDADCNGETDPVPEVVFVSPAGDDANSGIDPTHPVATLDRGVKVALSLARPVLVARGIYAGPLVLKPGLTLIGGYSPDFEVHDEVLYPVLIERAEVADGTPLLRCTDITVSSHVQGLTVAASDRAEPGQGNTAVLLDGCGPSVTLQNITVLAGRGGDGEHGADSSHQVDLMSLTGEDGETGRPGNLLGTACPTLAAGSGGAKMCDFDVSGGDGGDAQCAVLDCDNTSSAACGNSGCTDYTVGDTCFLELAKAAATPNPPAQPGEGIAPGLAGAQTYDAPTNRGVCDFCDDNPSLLRNGQDGADGADGVDGDGGDACDGELHIDEHGRVTASAGQDGERGEDGSGGGGGSAGGGYSVIANTVGTCSSVSGGSGGGGGSGGCGAPGAAGGGGGGGSVGIVIRLRDNQDAGPTLQNIRVVSSAGGHGADGGLGARGGAGGVGAVGGLGSFWCARAGGRGGDGGNGGSAGGGGGGCGGPSIGILLAPGSADTTGYASGLSASVLIQVAGTVRQGGQGGFSPAQSGKPGQAGGTHTLRVSPP
jgi:hypothetical protein